MLPRTDFRRVATASPTVSAIWSVILSVELPLPLEPPPRSLVMEPISDSPFIVFIPETPSRMAGSDDPR